MGKYQEEKKTPIIMVKKRRTLLPPSLSEKTGVIARSETVKMEDSVSVGSSSPAVDTHPLKLLPVRKKKDAVFHASLIGLMNLLTIAWKKLSLCFPIFAQKAGDFFH
ncbi:hypothetical protein ECZC04_53980 [Escherichia coli]|nr:hypothetical protein ECZC04_53980 [Escherichia coli]